VQGQGRRLSPFWPRPPDTARAVAAQLDRPLPHFPPIPARAGGGTRAIHAALTDKGTASIRGTMAARLATRGTQLTMSTCSTPCNCCAPT